jgi:hypothetical protein
LFFTQVAPGEEILPALQPAEREFRDASLMLAIRVKSDKAFALPWHREANDGHRGRIDPSNEDLCLVSRRQP